PSMIRGLSRGARSFFLDPPPGFTEHPLLSSRGMLAVGRADQKPLLEQHLAQSSEHIPGVQLLNTEEARSLVPLLREEYVAGAVLDPEAMDMDVHAIHWGFIRGMRARGGKLITGAELLGLERNVDGWIARTTAGDFAAPVVINAAGA